ncbi:ATP-grasp domain-containing protein [Anaerosporobacter faecicola]|uniref:ATP-grasp domain-containing protein n=1 Tax=Anaerosporobacter faecicola TaxID=2718714 RepID=UPI00143975BA|nr:RimK family alpha-L-glutamate ligase [Anaerosporobacter faecicola]
MKAWLVTNEFLNSQKYSELNMWLVNAAKKYDVELLVKTNAELLVDLTSGNGIEAKREKEQPQFVLFWDKDIRLASYLESLSLPVYNSAKAIEICDNKAMTHIALNQKHIRMPQTILAPMTYPNIGYTNYDFVDKMVEQLRFPMVVKECFGSFGQQVYLVHNYPDLLDCLNRIGTKPFLVQEYIKSSFARDIRLNVVGDQVVATMYRYSDTGDFRANISNGGKMRRYEPTPIQIETAIACVKALGLDFAGVDLLFDENEEPIVCEVNSNAHFKNIQDCTGVNVADQIIQYIVKKQSCL